MKIADIKVGMRFKTEENDIVRKFIVLKVTDKRITTTSEEGYAHKQNVNTMRCHSFGLKQVQSFLDTDWWKFETK